MKKLNLPNQLTLMRILLVPFIIILPLFSYIGENNFLNDGLWEDGMTVLNLIVLVIFCVASFTDYLDGHIARSRNLVTDFGKFLDPLADKLLVVSTMIYLLMIGISENKLVNNIFGCCVTIIIAREFAVTGLRLIASNKNVVIAASKWGKAKTVSQMVMIIVMLVNYLPNQAASTIINSILIGIATLLTIISGVDYFLKNKQVIATM